MDRRSEGFYVRREILDQQGLDEVARKRTNTTKPPLDERVKDSLRCSGPRLKRTVLGCVPVLSWLPRYSIRDNALGDLVSGFSVGIMHLPQGMAYALLASLPPVYGLYTSLFPVLVYCIFGTSRHISIGTFAVISIMIGSVTEKLAPDSDFLSSNGTNVTGGVDVAARDAYRVQIAASVTVLGGLFQILLGIVRFGFVVTYLSEPLVRGYTTGAAFHVVISQLKYMFGISPARFSGPLAQVYLLVDICRLLPQIEWGALVVSLVSLVVLITVKELNACYSKKLPMPIPIELLVLIAGTLISYYADLSGQYGVDVVGEIPSGLPLHPSFSLIPPRVPNVSLFSQLIGDAFAVAIVSYAINISLGKTFALKHGYKVDSNQELVALGLSNTVGGFFQCYTVTSSLSRSLIQESTGGKTQVAGLISSLIVLVCVLKVGALFEDLPKAVLATIVFVNLKGMFKQLHDIPLLWKTNKVDLLVWLVTLVSSFLLNLDIGLAVSIAFSLLTVIFRSQLPRYSVLGQVPGTELYVDMESYEEAREIPGVTIFRCSTTMYYANAEMYLEALQQKVCVCSGCGTFRPKIRNPTHWLSITHENRNGLLSKGLVLTEKESGGKGMNRKASLEGRHQTDSNGVGLALTERSDDGQSNFAFEHQAEPHSESESYQGISGEPSTVGGDEENAKGFGMSSHSIILDLSTASFVDTVTVSTLKTIVRDFGEIDVEIYIAACQACVVEDLERAGFFEAIPMSQLFASIHDAVLHCLRKQTLADTPVYDCVLDMACMTKL
ncbi:solute carrier family 26 member 6 [Aplochiton taeniatus]